MGFMAAKIDIDDSRDPARMDQREVDRINGEMIVWSPRSHYT